MDDYLILGRDDALFNLLSREHGDGMHISCEEKIDGANLGISLSLDGEILIQVLPPEGAGSPTKFSSLM